MRSRAFVLTGAFAYVTFIALGTATPASGAKPSVDVRRYSQDQWTLRITTDQFSGDTECKLQATRGTVLYTADALGFRFSPHRDTTGAWIRIDAGPAMRWRDLRPELARLGVPVDGRDLAAPTGGIVWVPAALLESAQAIDIQWRPGARARRFGVQGFAAMRESARSQGCRPEIRFGR